MITISRIALDAGQARFTVQSGRSGKHYTFKVERSKKLDWLFGSVKIRDAQGKNGYEYLGRVDPRGYLVTTTKSPKPEDSEAWRVLDFAIRRIYSQKPLPDGYSIQNTGRCCCCGRPLTDPESLKTGIRPICARDRLIY